MQSVKGFLIFSDKNTNGQKCMYIFTHCFCLPLKDAAGFLLSLVASNHFISSPEYVDSTHHAVVNFEQSINLKVLFYQSKLQNWYSTVTHVRLVFKKTHYDN